MSQRPTLKLKFGSQAPKAEPTDTPLPTSTPKLKLKFGKAATQPPASESTDPAPSSIQKPPPKPARKPKPTPKKRALENANDSSDSEPLAATTTTSTAATTTTKQPRIKKIKLSSKASNPSTPTVSTNTPFLKIKTEGQIPHRPKGVGYDSEAEDQEKDPTITSNFIIRMQPGEDCEYLRKAITEKNFGKGGADVRIRFLTRDGRRAVVKIQKRCYAAILVDLPCIIEAMKSWEKKAWWKSGDICQMLLVLDRCECEEEAKTFPLPSAKEGFDAKTWQWAHGITPPMRWARKRRFRKRISVKAVEAEEAEVERLLRLDEEAESSVAREYTEAELERILEREQSELLGSRGTEEEGDEDEDAEGDVDDAATLGQADAFGDEDPDLADELERALEQGQAEEDAAMQASSAAADSPAVADVSTPASIAETPGATAGTPAGVTSADDEDEDEEEEESDEDEVVDDDVLERREEEQRHKDQITDLESAIAETEAKLKGTGNAILRAKIAKQLQSLQADLEVKRGGGDN